MRKHQHNSDSKNETKTNKLYNTIRANGGISNWKFIVREICAYQPQTAFNKELYYIDALEADLNTKMPYRSLEEDKFYRVDNEEEIAECRKQYRLENAEKNNYNRCYNNEIIKEQKQKNIHCKICDAYHTKAGKSQHYKTKKHLANVNKL